MTKNPEGRGEEGRERCYRLTALLSPEAEVEGMSVTRIRTDISNKTNQKQGWGGGGSEPQPVVQISPAVCFCTAYKLRMCCFLWCFFLVLFFSFFLSFLDGWEIVFLKE